MLAPAQIWMGRAAEHLDVGSCTEDAFLERLDHHDPHLGMFEPETLNSVVELDVDAEVVGVHLQLPGTETTSLIDVHAKARYLPGDRELPVLVLIRMRAKVDVHEAIVPGGYGSR